MVIWIILALFLIIIVSYIAYTSYSIQLFFHKQRLKNFLLKTILNKLKGKYISQAYFASSHKTIPPSQFKTLSNKQKTHFSHCYNLIKFKTSDSNWELFFHLVKEGTVYNEILNLRVFPITAKIRSEANIEKSFGKLNIFANNKYLADTLEIKSIKEVLSNLLDHSEDIILISHNCIHYKTFSDPNMLNENKLMEIIKELNHVKNKIYKENTFNY